MEAAAAAGIKVHGEAYTRLPDDLYIPPDALRVFLEAFEGPLDLLLYLIRRQSLDILDIPVARICQQYTEYIQLMREMRFELAAEYLLMAAWLAEIKSRLLLPRPQAEDDEEADPRAELVRRLQEYERFKAAAEGLEALPRVERDIHVARARPPTENASIPQAQPGIDELLLALRDALMRADLFASHLVTREPLSVRECMSRVLARLSTGAPAAFTALLDPEEGRSGVVVTFLAVLELIKHGLIELEQQAPYAPVRLYVSTAREATFTDTGA